MIIDRRSGLPPIENQGSEPKCVGYAFSALAKEAGYEHEADYIYSVAQKLDALPGEDYFHRGTQLIGGMRMLSNSGLSGRVVEVSGEIPIIDQLQTSCVVVSVNAKIFGSEGHHAVLLCGYDNETDAFLVRNSWGMSWGVDGYHWVGVDRIIDNMADVGYGIIRKEKTKKYARKGNIIVGAGIGVGILLLGVLAYFVS